MGRLTRKLQTLLPLPSAKKLSRSVSFSRLPKLYADNKSQCLLKRLGSSHQQASTTPPKGHLPIRVMNACTSDYGILYYIKAEHLSHPIIVDLLQRAAEEFGYSRVGALQVTCDADTFEDILRTLNSTSQ